MKQSGFRVLATSLVVGLGSVGMLSTGTAAVAADYSIGYGAPGYTEGDLTGDGKIDTDDIAMITAAVGTTSADSGWSEVAAADANADGEIDITDVAGLSQKMIYSDGEFSLIDASVIDIQKAMTAGKLTSVELVQSYLDRIDAYDKIAVSAPSIANTLSSIIATNDEALTQAAALDEERAESGPRSLMHGIPVIVKDNYNTVDMPTTAGCKCLKDNQTSTDAEMVEKLKEAGAVIIAKANLSEFAIQNTSSISGLGGTTRNVYRLDRSAGGSSGGTAAAISANFGTIGLGTDTGGSIRIPAAWANLVGVRPTIGLASRDGIIPLALSQDTGGPMTRSVSDAAIALDYLVGYDPEDQVTAASDGNIPDTYTSYLDANGLQGARIGFISEINGLSTINGNSAAPGYRLVAEAKADLGNAGATVVDVTLPAYSGSSGSTNEFKHDLNLYLAKFVGSDVTLQTLIDLGAADSEYLSTAQTTLISRNNVTQATYDNFMTTHMANRAALQELLNGLLDDDDEEPLDAFVYLSASGVTISGTSGTVGTINRLSAFSGYPAISVPAGFASSPPDSTSGSGIPMGIEFLAKPYEEGKLLKFAYAYEQEAQNRVPSTLFPALPVTETE